MMRIRNIPIQRKLTLVIMLTSTAVLFAAALAFIAYEMVTFRQSMTRNLLVIARIISANSAASLIFEVPSDAEDILASLRVERHIIIAVIYDGEGELFAQYVRAEAEDQIVPEQPRHDGFGFRANHLSLAHPIIHQNARVGTLFLRMDLEEMRERLWLYGWIVAFILTGAILLAFALSKLLQRQISQPVLELSNAARIVSEKKDYTVRARKYGEDELGRLTETFNDMLGRIHEQDAALRASGERLRLALMASHTGTWDWNLHTNRIVWDEFVPPLFGLAPGQFDGTYEANMQLVHPDDRRDVREAADVAIRKKGDFGVEFRTIWPDGSVHHLAARGKAFARNDGPPVHLAGVFLDITASKLAEEEIRTLNAELEERVLQRTAELAASNRELEAFTYSISHDLRAPLRHIIAFGDMLQEDFAENLPEDARGYVERMVASARNLSQMVDDLLNLARLGRRELSRRPTDLNDIVHQAIDDLKPEVQTRRIEWKIARLPETRCDPGLVKQVFANLLSNAAKYTRPREAALIEIGASELDGLTVFFVRDNGVGFDMKYADRLFGVFQRLHRQEEFEGTGVGLATVERIIQKHGGRIWAEAAPGQGATFFFTLQPGSAAQPEPSTASDLTS